MMVRDQLAHALPLRDRLREVAGIFKKFGEVLVQPMVARRALQGFDIKAACLYAGGGVFHAPAQLANLRPDCFLAFSMIGLSAERRLAQPLENVLQHAGAVPIRQTQPALAYVLRGPMVCRVLGRRRRGPISDAVGPGRTQGEAPTG